MNTFGIAAFICLGISFVLFVPAVWSFVNGGNRLDWLGNTACVVFAIGFVLLVIGVCKEPKKTDYPLTTEIVELDRENDVVTCEDFNGYLWQFEGCEDWQEGDICSMIMNDNGTAEIFDDKIVSVRYSGTFEGWN